MGGELLDAASSTATDESRRPAAAVRLKGMARSALPTGRLDTSRLRLRALDSCLTQLEDAHERDEKTLTADMASRLRAHVPALAPGMSITQAIDLVLRQQERYLHGGDGQAGPEAANGGTEVSAWLHVLPDGGDDPLGPEAARELTQRIRLATQQVCLLLLEAHDRRAAGALGYPTWEQYVLSEFGLSRSRSYELLDQARVIRALQSAAGVTGWLDVSARAASRIKLHLLDMVRAARLRTRNLPEAERLEVVNQLVREVRARVNAESRDRRAADRRSGPPAGEGPEGVEVTDAKVRGEPDELEELLRAIECLASMPAASEVLARIPDQEAHRLRSLPRAVIWLADFSEQWARRRSRSGSRVGALPVPRGA
jgi:hypothetical protein